MSIKVTEIFTGTSFKGVFNFVLFRQVEAQEILSYLNFLLGLSWGFPHKTIINVTLVIIKKILKFLTQMHAQKIFDVINVNKKQWKT